DDDPQRDAGPPGYEAAVRAYFDAVGKRADVGKN
ncbi:MAG: hypothetical protein JWO31_1375, partial [Phycisphaerales bacterium]|nr:hypothetical protein [Phycisphaerales bacterium]